MIAVVVPSRGRPGRCTDMVTTVLATSSFPVRVLVVIPPEQDLVAYAPVVAAGAELMRAPSGFVKCLNAGAALALRDPRVDVIGAFGDDVAFRTPGWDVAVEAVMPGIAYGDDLIHGRNHPTAVWVSRVIVEALGWVGLPTIGHQWADDVWKRLGQESGTLHFVEGVIVEHLHPAVGKAEWDDTYRAITGATPEASEQGKRDFGAFEAWLEDGLAADVATVRAAIA